MSLFQIMDLEHYFLNFLNIKDYTIMSQLNTYYNNFFLCNIYIYVFFLFLHKIYLTWNNLF